MIWSQLHNAATLDGFYLEHLWGHSAFDMLMFLIKIFQRIKLSESWTSSALSKKLTFAVGRTCENPSCPSVQRGGRAPSANWVTAQRYRHFKGNYRIWFVSVAQAGEQSRARTGGCWALLKELQPGFYCLVSCVFSWLSETSSVVPQQKRSLVWWRSRLICSYVVPVFLASHMQILNVIGQSLEIGLTWRCQCKVWRTSRVCWLYLPRTSATG